MILAAVALLFVVETFRSSQLQWLWFSIAIWLFGGWFSAQLLPSILGITHWFNAYLLHFYVFVGSAFFWINSIEKQPENDTRSTWQANSSPLLTLLALASLAMHGGLAMLLGVIVWQYPKGLSTVFAPAVWQLYCLYPAAWWAMTVLLMVIFAGHRVAIGEKVTQFTLRQLQCGLLIALLMQLAWVGAQLSLLYSRFK